MKRLMCIIFIVVFSSNLIYAQQTEQDKPQTKQKPKQQRIYYGGVLGLSFGSYFHISVEPLVGYKISPKFSTGAKIRYEYIKDTRNSWTVEASNYGASLFARYRIIPQIYLHAEPSYMSYQYSSGNFESERDWVPFVFVGAGYNYLIGTNTWLTAEVLFDVLQDDKSPYKDWEPFYSIGVGIGF
jgi:hypothetical protein